MTFFALCTCIHVLTSKSLHNPKIIDNKKFYVMAYTVIFNGFIDMLYRILSTDKRGSSWSAVMTASGATGSDGVVAMTTTVSQHHWMHVWFTMYWMYVLSYIVLSQKWLNKDDQINISPRVQWVKCVIFKHIQYQVSYTQCTTQGW